MFMFHFVHPHVIFRFLSGETKQKRIKSYFLSLKDEMLSYMQGSPFDTVFIGGALLDCLNRKSWIHCVY